MLGPRPAGRPIIPTPRTPTVHIARPWYLPCKTAIDFVLALLIGMVALPLIVLSALAVRLTSRGPAFYSQMRVGQRGRLFRIWKIRTMIHNCESLTGPRWSIPGDPRITPVGWFLRRSHLDELPQLLNVLLGQMSLVGPRPERPEFVPELERAIPAYQRALEAQTGGHRPGSGPVATRHRRPERAPQTGLGPLLCDARQSLAGFPLLVSTLFYAFGVKFERFGHLLGLPAAATVQGQMDSV